MKKSLISLVSLILIGMGFYFYQNYYKDANKNMDKNIDRTTVSEAKQMSPNTKTLTYKDITFTAPNTLPSPYRVVAERGGKVLWEINNSVRLADMSEQEKENLKKGGIETLLIQDVQESILDKNADNFQELKKYIGKPALYIYNILIAGEKSVDVRDINTGERIGFIVHN
jgi:hypothetical protein